MQRRISVLFVVLKKLYKVGISKVMRLWFSKIKYASLDGVLGLEEFFRVFESRLFIVLSRFLIFQKKKVNSKQLVLTGSLQVNGRVVTNPFYIVPFFSFIKVLKGAIPTSKYLKKLNNLNLQSAIKALADFKILPINKKKIYKKAISKAPKYLNGLKKKLKFIRIKDSFLQFNGASTPLIKSLILSAGVNPLKIKNKRYLLNNKPLNLYKKSALLYKKIKSGLKLRL